MRAIKFRGKSLADSEWVYGYYIYDTPNKQHYILEFGYGVDDIAEVDPDTVGQFTGKADKNGQEIYTGDILDCGADATVAVYWDTDHGCFAIKDVKTGEYYGLLFNAFGKHEEPVSVIGNITNNPELMEGK